LRPATPDASAAIAIPQVDGLVAPAGSENLVVTPGAVTVDGAFPELAAQTRAIVAQLQGHRVNLAQIYAAASAIEAAHARAGYVLARVTMPPQQLVEGGALRIVVVDGFIEDIDVTDVPDRVRRAVLARVAGLKGRRHLRLGAIEQPLLIAAQVPGLTMTSTLARGTSDGGTRLILAGHQALISGSIGTDNSLASSLGTYSASAQIAINSAFGLGEQIYGLATSGYDVTRLFSAGVPVRVLGGGVVLPLGDGRLTVNPEATIARTQPAPVAGTPQSRGDLRRLTLRGDYVLEKTRRHTADALVTVEQIDETNTELGFAPISHDRYMALRAGVSLSATGFDGATIGGTVQLSQGLGGLGALSPGDLARDYPGGGTTFSRQGASTNFTKLNVTVNARVPVGGDIVVSLVAKGQSSFGEALFRAEQGSLEGSDAVSGFVGGITASDSAASLRGELGKTWSLPGAIATQIAPYLFAAGGLGRLERPTIVEQATLKVASLGLGLRFNLPRYGISAAVEYAHNFADLPGRTQSDRVNFTTSLHF
jgi:hemolysin activation/secretion protein